MFGGQVCHAQSLRYWKLLPFPAITELRVIGEFFLRQPVASCIMMRSLLFACWLAKLMARACCNSVFVE